MWFSGRFVKMRGVDIRLHPGARLVRPTIPSLAGVLLPSGRAAAVS
jgi:hypothetical protein